MLISHIRIKDLIKLIINLPKNKGLAAPLSYMFKQLRIMRGQLEN